MPLANPYRSSGGGGFSYGGGPCCEPAFKVPVPESPAPPCQPTKPVCPPDTKPAKPVCDHCYFSDFRQLYPDLSCWDDDQVCAALKGAGCYTDGIFDECIRKEAAMAAAAHLLEIQNVQATESASRLAAASKGALSRPSGGSDDINDWWRRTLHGERYLQAINRDRTVDIFVI